MNKELTLEQFINDSIKLMMNQSEGQTGSEFIGLESNNISVIRMVAADYYKGGYTVERFIAEMNNSAEDFDVDFERE